MNGDQSSDVLDLSGQLAGRRKPLLRQVPRQRRRQPGSGRARPAQAPSAVAPGRSNDRLGASVLSVRRRRPDRHLSRAASPRPVWVEFEQGDLAYPIWSGTYWTSGVAAPRERSGQAHRPHAVRPHARIRRHRWSGKGPHRARRRRQALRRVRREWRHHDHRQAGAQVHLDADGSQLVIEDANGNTITLSQSGTSVEDSNGHSITMDASGAKISATQIVLDGTMVMLGGAGGEPVLKGQSFLQFFMTHVHPTGVGPSGPPIPQGEVSSLSTTVMTK